MAIPSRLCPTQGDEMLAYSRPTVPHCSAHLLPMYVHTYLLCSASRTLVLQAPTRAEHRFWVRNLVQLAINAVYKGSTLTGTFEKNRAFYVYILNNSVLKQLGSTALSWIFKTEIEPSRTKRSLERTVAPGPARRALGAGVSACCGPPLPGRTERRSAPPRHLPPAMQAQ
jgi:hypothetical protein